MTQSVQAQVDQSTKDYLSFVIADQVFGMPVELIQDIFMPESLTAVPLSDETIAGVLNLRGTIVTMIDGHASLGLPKPDSASAQMAIRLEYEGESYGLMVDTVGDVLSLTADFYEENPSHLDPAWRRFAKGVYRLDDALMVVLDVFEVLNLKLAHGVKSRKGMS